MNEKYSGHVKNILEKVESKGEKVKKVYLYVVPFELEKIVEKKIKEKINKEVKIYSVKDPKKFDPENKAKKAKPGMPGVYLE